MAREYDYVYDVANYESWVFGGSGNILDYTFMIWMLARKMLAKYCNEEELSKNFGK